MSFVFSVSGQERSALRYADVARLVGQPLGVVEDLEPNDHVRGLVHFYRPGLTTRATEVEAGAEDASVRILTCASIEDHDLAVAILIAVAEQRGALNVQPEADDPIPVSRVRDRYDAAWAADEVEFGAAAIARTVDANPGKLITLQGPIRPFLVGDRLIADLRQGTEHDFASRLIEVFRGTQWPGDCHAASVLEIGGGSSDKRTRLAVLAGGGRTLLPDVDAIVLQDPTGGQVYVRPAQVAELLPEHARYLDERHLLVEPVEEVRWAELLHAAQDRALDLDDL
jgi:hypothetical protein